MAQRLAMAQDRSHRRLSSRGLAGVVAAGLLLASCSYVPNWANPVAWYDGAAGAVGAVFGGGDDEDNADEGGEFPRLSTVPERPATAPAGEREQVAQGLVADRENARYTDEIIRSDAAPRAVAPAPAPRTQVAAAAPAQEPAPPPRRRVTEAQPVPPPAAVARTTIDEDIDSRRTITTSRVNAPPRRTAAPQPVPPVVPQSIVRREAAPAPAPVVRTTTLAQAAPAPALVLQAPPPVAARGDEVGQVFARLLAQSAATVTTAPANAAFQVTAAAPIGMDAPVAAIIRETYNAALAATNQTAAIPLTQVASAAAVAPTVVKFAVGSARINRRYAAALQEVVAQHRRSGGIIRVVGHASTRTRDLPLVQHNLVNFRISVDRAQAVAAELIRLGVPPGSVFAEARGDSQPIFFEVMPQGEAENRRAEIFLVF